MMHQQPLISNELLGDPIALRKRMDRDGYLFLKHFLPTRQVAQVREDIVAICQRTGWLLTDEEGDLKPRVPVHAISPDLQHNAVHRQVIGLESFNTLAHVPAIIDLMAILLENQNILVHPAKSVQLVRPQTGVLAAPAHQDFLHRQGTEQSYTCWIPLGDCPRPLGGMAIWPGSHTHGFFEHEFIPGLEDLSIDTAWMAIPWTIADFRLGDVLIFHSLTVHRALPNTTDQLRIAMDCRYQRVHDPVAAPSLRPSGGQLTWDEIYCAWQSKRYQFYWKQWDLNVVPYDYRYTEKRDRELLEQARQGNPSARQLLMTMIARNPDPMKVAMAREVVKEFDGRFPEFMQEHGYF